MKTQLEHLIEIANKVKSSVKINDSLLIRETKLCDALKKEGYIVTVVRYAEKPHAGASFRVKKMHDCFRINFRCGYGKHNYAPVVEVEFKNDVPLTPAYNEKIIEYIESAIKKFAERLKTERLKK